MIIISHNKEFCGAVAEEKWIMKGGRLTQEGESKGTGEDEKKAGLDVEKEVCAARKKQNPDCCCFEFPDCLHCNRF